MSHARVIYHFDDGNWWADSPDVDRWSAAAPDVAALVQLVVEGVPFALEEDDVEITHHPAPDLIDVFAGGTAGGRLRLKISDAFRGLLPDQPRAGIGDAALAVACGR
jgi:hypothetical protein